MAAATTCSLRGAALASKEHSRRGRHRPGQPMRSCRRLCSPVWQEGSRHGRQQRQRQPKQRRQDGPTRQRPTRQPKQRRPAAKTAAAAKAAAAGRPKQAASAANSRSASTGVLLQACSYRRACPPFASCSCVLGCELWRELCFPGPASGLPRAAAPSRPQPHAEGACPRLPHLPVLVLEEKVPDVAVLAACQPVGLVGHARGPGDEAHIC